LSRQSAGRAQPGKGSACYEIVAGGSTVPPRCRTTTSSSSCCVREIARRGLRPGDLLPGDHALCEAYDVIPHRGPPGAHRAGVRGVIERVKGEGTFVAQPKTRRPVQSLTGLFEDVAAEVGTCTVRCARCGGAGGQPHRRGAAHPTGHPVVLLRSALLEELPWVLTVTHMPHDLCPGWSMRTDRQSLYALLEDRYGIRLVRGAGRWRHPGRPGAGRRAGLYRWGRGAHPAQPERGRRGPAVESFVAYHRGDRSGSRWTCCASRSRPPSRRYRDRGERNRRVTAG